MATNNGILFPCRVVNLVASIIFIPLKRIYVLMNNIQVEFFHDNHNVFNHIMAINTHPFQALVSAPPHGLGRTIARLKPAPPVRTVLFPSLLRRLA